MQAWSAGAAIVDGNARGSIQFLKYLELLAATAGDTATATQLAEIADRVDALEGESQANIVGTGSVSAVKSGNNWIVQLRGDNSDPNNGMLYGANEHGPGWLSVAEVFQPGSDFVVHDSGYLLLGVLDSEADLPGSSTLNDAYRVKSALWYWDGSDWVQDPSPSGVLEIALADLADSGTGTFKLITRDAQGRISGSESGTTDDVPEGSTNLYFHEAPSNGNEYVRKDGDWAVASGGGSGGRAYVQPDFSNVSSLLHFDGSNGSTTITDQVAGNTWTANNATISTAQLVVADQAISFTGSSNSGISMPTNTRFDVGTGLWALEFSLWPNASGHEGFARVFQTRNGDVVSGISLNFSSGNTLGLQLSSNGSSVDILNASDIGSLKQSAVNRCILQRTDPTTIEFFINGFRKYTATISASASIYYNSSDSIILGGNVSGTSRSCNAYMDEARFTKGAYIVGPEVTVPGTAFPDS